MQGLQRNHRRHHIGGNTRPSSATGKQIGEHLIGEQLLPMRSQKRKHAARLEKMPRYRFRIQQFTLAIRLTLHPTIISDNQHRQADATPNYSGHS